MCYYLCPMKPTELAQNLDITPDALRARIRRLIQAGAVQPWKYSASESVPADIIAALSGERPQTPRQAPKQDAPAQVPTIAPIEPPRRAPSVKTVLFWTLGIIPVGLSVVSAFGVIELLSVFVKPYPVAVGLAVLVEAAMFTGAVAVWRGGMSADNTLQMGATFKVLLLVQSFFNSVAAYRHSVDTDLSEYFYGLPETNFLHVITAMLIAGVIAWIHYAYIKAAIQSQQN